MKISLSVFIVIASAGAFAQGATSHDSPAHPAPVEGVWCFDIVQSGNAIHVLTGDLRAQKATLWYSRSHDGGYRWSGSAHVDTALSAPQPSLLSDHARIGARGDRLLAAWSVGGAGAGENAAVSSLDGGRSWRKYDPADSGLSTRRGGAVVAGRDAGSLHALGRPAIDGGTGLHYRASADGGKTWRQPVKLGGDNARNPDLVRAPDGMLAAAWEEVSGPDSTIFYALSLDDGQTWGPSARLSDGGSEATHPRVVVNKEGYLVLWLERWRNSERVLQRGYIGVQHRH